MREPVALSPLDLAQMAVGAARFEQRAAAQLAVADPTPAHLAAERAATAKVNAARQAYRALRDASPVVV